MANKDELIGAARNPWWRAAAIVAALALVATFALGGFKPAKDKTKPLAQYSAGQRVQSGAMAVTPVRAWVAHYRPGGRMEPNQLYLVLQADIENLTGRSYSGFGYPRQDLILVSAQREPVQADNLLMADDHGVVADLHPRLSQRVDLIWKLPPAYVYAPRQTFGLFARDYKAKAYLNDEGAWLQGDPLAKLDLPVQDLRDRLVAP
ncbi:hypothetical protein ASD78_00295 [Lysobacter sp. Root667]|uniref:hypothetical protein n=1 Tax=Lysobacter sp. Root667 TaxID=1736581 RepID=UPI0006F5ADA1|nr:hypothetical protein [Lysobacter sp. Root667]KRA81757.1 hypothetical protein ASD78_00295 [Lysobacter sp. Root667]